MELSFSGATQHSPALWGNPPLGEKNKVWLKKNKRTTMLFKGLGWIRGRVGGHQNKSHLFFLLQQELVMLSSPLTEWQDYFHMNPSFSKTSSVVVRYQVICYNAWIKTLESSAPGLQCYSDFSPVSFSFITDNIINLCSILLYTLWFIVGLMLFWTILPPQTDNEEKNRRLSLWHFF